MGPDRVKSILKAIRNTRVAVYGDFCLDAYLVMDPRGSEISLETGLKAEAVDKHYYTPGGASNIVANLAALQPAEILTIGVLGDDLYGRELLRQLDIMEINTSFLIQQKEDFNTYVFTKKIFKDSEEPRIDFGTYNQRDERTDAQLIAGIRYALENYDLLIYNQQVPWSITNADFIVESNSLFSSYPDKMVLLDSRHYNEQFDNVCRKVNDVELTRLSDIDHKSLTLEEVEHYAKQLFKGKPIFVTCGERGIISVDDTGTSHAPGMQLLNRLDTVGAGDTTMSALACCLASGISASEAAIFANYAAAVTVQKLFTTGTASGEEIISMSKDPDFIYRPDLAVDPDKAVYLPGSSIEICNPNISNLQKKVRHILFDHDGTLSLLRQGWESVMQETMVKSIRGKGKVDKSMLARIEARVSEYINVSTGVQTIVQMEMLVSLVKEFGLVAENEIKDKFAYKSVYLRSLLRKVEERLAHIARGEVKKDTYRIRGAIEFLNELKARGNILYLASGTDNDFVRKEAGIMGYEDLFDGGIFGSVDDISKYSKKIVIENIIESNHLKDYEFAVIGDGPVEIREGKKRSGITIGVASDEQAGTGLDKQKRERLIKAGADLVVPDFTDHTLLLELLNS